MKKAFFLSLACGVHAFGQGFETKLLTETIEMGGGVEYFNSHSGGTENEFQTKLLSGLNRYVSLFGEYSYSRLISGTTYPGAPIALHTSAMDMGGGVQVHYSGYRVQPYLLAGIGSVRWSQKESLGALHATQSSYQFDYELGGGVRIFATKHFGFSAEAKTFRGTSGAGMLFNQFTLGAFFQQQAPRW